MRLKIVLLHKYLNTVRLLRSKILLFCLTLLLLTAISCEQSDPFEIPSVYLDFAVNIQNDVEYYSLQSAGNSKQITAQAVGKTTLGYKNNGVILFNNGGEFYAFDRTCPYEFPDNAIVETDGAGSAECPVCGSIFLFSAIGMPAMGSPAKYPLKEYRTEYFPGSGVVRVYN